MSNGETAIVTVQPEERGIQLGVLQANTPASVIARASEVSTQLAKIVKERKLSRQISGREYVFVEGWSTMGAMIGVLPREVETIEHENGDFESTVELIRASDGAVVGRGSALVGADEGTWNKRPRYARRSMAITRATGKAYRLGFSWIMSLAGYAPTPAEEMDGVIDGEIVEERTQPPAPRASTKTVKAWSELRAQAQGLGIEVEVIPGDITEDELRAKGKALRAKVEEAQALKAERDADAMREAENE